MSTVPIGMDEPLFSFTQLGPEPAGLGANWFGSILNLLQRAQGTFGRQFPLDVVDVFATLERKCFILS
jgi:hypothetical protein